jgi:hypothetical protein
MKIKYNQARHHPLFRRYTWIRYESKRLGWPVEWDSCWHFFEDIEDHLGIPPNIEDLYLLRQDQSQPYTLSNLMWGNRIEQGYRYARTNLLTYQNKTQSLKQWSQELGISYATLYKRLRAGMTTPEILADIT